MTNRLRFTFHLPVPAFALGMLAVFTILATAPALGQKFKVLHTFTDGKDGAIPVGGLTIDRAGNLYGATDAGGDTSEKCQFGGAANGCGTVFKLIRGRSGWAVKPLHIFQGGTDGLFPSSRVIFGPDGALYGVTSSGGTFNCNAGFGTCGMVFKVTPPASDCKSVCRWHKSTLFSFSGPDGDEPVSEVVFDRAGNLYGTTYGGGGNGGAICLYDNNGCGTVYELSPSKSTWTETVLYAFPVTDTDGQNPDANLIFGSSGNLYGSTGAGGTYSSGTVFQLSPAGSTWTENLLYSFDSGSSGIEPVGGLLLSSGNLIGTTSGSGADGGGTVFELTPNQSGWTFSLIYSLTGQGYFGPEASLIMDAAGNLYGTTVAGGAHSRGSVFKLTPSNGGWKYTSLHDFTGGSDGWYVESKLVMDAKGNLYGVAGNGGGGSCFNGCGTVFEITP